MLDLKGPFSLLLVISSSDPFATLPQAIGCGPSLMITPSSIPSSATKMPDVERLHNEASDEVLEDSDDEPIVKTRVSDFKDSSNEEMDAVVIYIYIYYVCLSLTWRQPRVLQVLRFLKSKGSQIFL